MGGGSSCSAPRLRSDVAHVKADFFSVEFTADFWYLSVVSGAKRTPIKTSNNNTTHNKCSYIFVICLFSLYLPIILCHVLFSLPTASSGCRDA
jgi:hypothetical protein